MCFSRVIGAHVGQVSPHTASGEKERKRFKMKFKMLMCVVFLMAMVFATNVVAQQKAMFKTDVITLAPGVTNKTVIVNLMANPIEINNPIAYRELECFTFKNISTSITGAVFVTAVDGGVDVPLLSYIEQKPGDGFVEYPLRSYLSSVTAGWVVTGILPVAKSTYTTNYVPYSVRSLEVVVTQALSAAEQKYLYTIKAK